MIKQQILAGRKAVDAYREAHRLLHLNNWHKGIPEEHTPLLEKLIMNLEKQKFTSTEKDFETKKTKILKKFWDESNLLNVQELGYIDMADFIANATIADRKTLKGMWH